MRSALRFLAATARGSGLLFLLLLPAVVSPASAGAGTLRLAPMLTLQEEYTDNIFFAPEDEASDLLTTLAAGVEVERRTERLQATLLGRLGLLRYLEHDELDAVDRKVRGKLDWALGPRWGVAVEAENVRDHRPDRELETTGLIFDAFERDRQNYGAAARYALSERSRLGVAYSFGREDFENPRFNDNRSHLATFSLTRDFRPDVQGGASLEFTRLEFDSFAIDSYVLQGTALWKLRERWELSGSLGGRFSRSEFEESRLVFVPVPPFFVTVTEERSAEDWGWVGALGLKGRGEKWQGHLALSRAFRVASGRAGTTESTTAVLDLSRRMTPRLSGTFSAGWYLNRASGGETAALEIDETTIRLAPGVRYEFSPSLTVRGEYSFSLLSDDDADRETVRNLILVGVEYRYPLFE